MTYSFQVKDKTFVVDEEDRDLVSSTKFYLVQKKWLQTAYSKRLHYMILERMGQKFYPKWRVFYADGNCYNLTRKNLSLVAPGETKKLRDAQKKVEKPSKYLGVSYVPVHKLWRAKISKDVSYDLGLFRDEITAAVVWNKATIKLFGINAEINNIPDWEQLAEFFMLPF